MKCDICGGPLAEQIVTYSIELADRPIVAENVPAKVCLQCGERPYSADVVERHQETVWEDGPPSRLLETPVFDFAEA